MRRVYAYATQTVVWLGPSIPETKAFMVDLARVDELAKMWTMTRFRSERSWRGHDWPLESDDFWVGLFHILNHEWFRRLWYV